MHPIIALSMTEDVVMAVIGILLIVFGLKATAVSGAMPGAKPLCPPPLSDSRVFRHIDAGAWIGSVTAKVNAERVC